MIMQGSVTNVGARYRPLKAADRQQEGQIHRLEADTRRSMEMLRQIL